MTSSLRNSIHRRNHKERSQLAHRAKLGLLEKHADYVKRARDYHSKQVRLLRLRQKAAERNKDEFYFSMLKEKTKGGVHHKDRGNVALPTDIVKVLKSQDENYVRTMRTSGLKKIDKIKNNLMEMADLLHTPAEEIDEPDLDERELKILQAARILHTSGKASRKRKHILFAESAEEAARLSAKGKGKETIQDPAEELSHETLEEVDLGWKSTEAKKKSRRKSADSATGNQSESSLLTETVQRDVEKRRKLLKELSARLDRDRQLRYAEREFEMQRQLMGKGARKKIQGVEKVEGDEEEEENEDEIDARKGRRRQPASRQIDEETYRPRVYKWRLERKR
ncbi:U3 small nucleolar RNA-associated protein 11 [Psilocybe cubensis]|uniref:U3 small nucleolar RNA-associated protein 11 n=2 Tax=Psilocybe cubensis TaxID=181762 RepID=A0A8H7YA86_PSICU|nr:U3 small nucleolar RNA-associated protein 11 [Psilocybe cubensis]KAH9486545.1 U3 small nucleolar RNA-associated protein 11 [Psilocybe cubensis]